MQSALCSRSRLVLHQYRLFLRGWLLETKRREESRVVDCINRTIIIIKNIFRTSIYLFYSIILFLEVVKATNYSSRVN